MSWRHGILGLGVLVGMLAADYAQAGFCLHRCLAACNACCVPQACGSWQMVEKEVCVPETVTENRTVKCVECRPEVRQRTVTCYERVPVMETVERQCTVMVPETRTIEQCQVVCKPVMKTVTQQICVPKYVTETRQGTRQVCTMQEVKQMQTVCEDQGHWEEQPCPANPCDPCKPVAATQRVWVAKPVQKQVEVTCMKPVMVSEPCTYQVCVYKPEIQTRQVQVCDYQREVIKRPVQVTVCVPKCETRKVQVCTYKCNAVQKVVNETVMVPHEVERVVQACVCKMVTKKVQVCEWVPAAPVAAAPCCK